MKNYPKYTKEDTKNKKYKTTVLVEDGWGVQEVNFSTGEIREITQKVISKKDSGFSNPMKKEAFTRTFEKAWEELDNLTSDAEYRAASKLHRMAIWKTNSLRPLSDETTAKALGDHLGKDQRVVKRIVNKLFKLGVLGKFSVYDDKYHEDVYWRFNPYLGFNGPVMDDTTWYLFRNTRFAKIYRDLKNIKKELSETPVNIDPEITSMSLPDDINVIGAK